MFVNLVTQERKDSLICDFQFTTQTVMLLEWKEISKQILLLLFEIFLKKWPPGDGQMSPWNPHLHKNTCQTTEYTTLERQHAFLICVLGVFISQLSSEHQVSLAVHCTSLWTHHSCLYENSVSFRNYISDVPFGCFFTLLWLIFLCLVIYMSWNL